jgi:hypothetical protein
MALEDLIGKEGTDKISKDLGLSSEKIKPFSIDPSHDYERDEFVDRADALFDLNEHYSALRQNVNDMDALGDVVKDLKDHIPAPQILVPELYKNPHQAIAEADRFLSRGIESMAKFVERNRRNMLGKLDEKALYGLFQSVPSYTTGNPEYDRVKNLKEKIMQMEKVKKEGGDIGALVQKEVEGLLKKAGEEQAEYFQRYGSLIIPKLVDRVIEDLYRSFQGLFRDKDGKLDKKAIIDYLEANYEVAEDEIRDTDNPKDKYDLWDKNLKSQYLAIAQTLLGPEKKAKKEEKDPEREKWKKVVKSKGLRI